MFQNGRSLGQCQNHRILTWGIWNFTHGDSGERTAKIHSGTMAMTSYTYDAFEQLMGVDASGLDRDYVLDGVGRRFQIKTSSSLDGQYVYDGQYKLVGELDSSNDVKKLYVYGSRAHVPDYYTDGTDDFMFVTDHLGSVRLVVKVSDGTVVQRNDYNDLGGVSYTTGASAQPLRYSGGVYDADSGFMKFGYRDYDPETGRWMSKDPILFRGGDMNLYGYVLADPVNLIDPTGLRTFIGGGSGGQGAIAGGLIGGSVGGVGGAIIGGAIGGGIGWIGGQIGGSTQTRIDTVSGGIVGGFIGGAMGSFGGAGAGGALIGGTAGAAYCSEKSPADITNQIKNLLNDF